MKQSEVLSVKAAAREADAHAAQLFMAIRRGHLHVRKEGGRTLVLRESFVQWKRRLEMKRALRREEKLATSARWEKIGREPGSKRPTGEPFDRVDGVSR